MAEIQTFIWSPDGLVEHEAITPEHVYAADSWRLENGYVVELNRHRVRFQNAVCIHRSLIETSHAFVEAVVDALPREGSWFPRIDLIRADGQILFRYQQRPRPPVSTDAVLATGRLDPRTEPLTKGPDLHALQALRDDVARQGADEAIVVRNGYVCEGAYSTVMAWSMDGRTLHSMGPDEPRVPSVTESVLREIALEEGLKVSNDRFTPDDLDRLEVWVVSALHGIRRARKWIDGPVVMADSGKRDHFAEKWWARAKQLPAAASPRV